MGTRRSCGLSTSPIKAALKPEVMTAAGGLLAGAGGLTTGTGPVQIALAVCLVVAVVVVEHDQVQVHGFPHS